MKKLNWELIWGIISVYLLFGLLPTLFLYSYLTDEWRLAKKYLENKITKTELLENDTTFNSDPSFKGTFLVFYRSDKRFIESISGLTGDREHKVSDFNGFYTSLDDCYHNPSYSFNVPNDQLKGLAFNDHRKTNDNDYIMDVENLKILAIARPFFKEKLTYTGDFISIHKDPLTGRELSRSGSYTKTTNFATYGIEMLMYDIKKKDVVFKKVFTNDDPINEMYQFLSANCLDENIKN